MIETPGIVRTTLQHYAALRLHVTAKELQQVMGQGIDEVLAALKSQNHAPSGPWFTHHFRKPTEFFDFEICMPVAEPINASGRVLPGVWPAMTVARTVYHGNYPNLPHAWGELGAWMKAEGHGGGTEFWERYTVNPHTTPNAEDWRTELNWPLLDAD